MHDLLYYSTMYVGEGGTMAAEAAVLGTPSIFVNTLTMGYIEELQMRYGLLYRFTNYSDTRLKIEELLSNPKLKMEWQHRRENMLKDKIDLTDWIVDVIENYLH